MRRDERGRITGVLGPVLLLNVVGWSLYLYYGGRLAEATPFVAAGPVAYALGARHAFDADHIAAIDDATRLMLQRGRRSAGVGLFFALGHSSVVLVLAVVVATTAGFLGGPDVHLLQRVGGAVSAAVAAGFLLLVGVLNAVVLRNLWRMRARQRRGDLAEREVDDLLGTRGVMSRLLYGRTRRLVGSNWHMFPVGALFGLGLETATEVGLLAMSGATATGHHLPVLALLALPLLFAAGMSTFDTADGLLMARLYRMSSSSPGRRLSFNTAMTAVTVVVSLSVGLIYLAGILVSDFGLTALRGIAAIGDQFELVGYLIVGTYLLTWIGTVSYWRFSDRRGADAGWSQGAVAQFAEPTRTP